jgi:ABC-type transport system involved in cytochrome bd biosynthesis fused ATPase/permease subunit
VGAADSLKTFMETPLTQVERGEKTLNDNDLIGVEARDLLIKSPEGKVLAGPLNFHCRRARGAGRAERLREKFAAEYTARLLAL